MRVTPKLFWLILKNVGRNPLRSILTALGTMVLVCAVTLVWSVLAFLDEQTAAKSKNLKVIVTERWRLPSRMPFSYAATLSEGAARRPGDVRPLDYATWQFYGGSIDPEKLTRESMLFAIATEPRKALTMLDELDTMSPEQLKDLEKAVDRLEQNKQGIIIGRERLQALNKKIGERIKVYSIIYQGIDLEFDILGTFPESRYDNAAVMNRDYLNDAIDAYNRQPGNLPHPLTEKSLNLVWLRVADMAMFARISEQIESAPYYASPAVKVETASSGIGAFLEAFSDLLWGMRYLLAPAALATLSLIIANAISISVRERRMELAVLKVLGFRPFQIMAMVLGEALLIGFVAGLASAGLTYVVINEVLGGFKLPLGFFGAFYIPPVALAWGAGIGLLTALLGSLLPAWSAQKVKVAEVFSKVT